MSLPRLLAPGSALGVLAVLGMLAVMAVDSHIAVRDEPPALCVTFSNLPPAWTLEKSADLTNWHSVIRAGEQPPDEVCLLLTNRAQALFYRIR